VVEDYIRKNIGPLALAADLARTLQVLARFGPRLPGLVEERLLRPAPPPEPPRGLPAWTLAAALALGIAAGVAAVVLARLI
jgi:ubiquinone biosynthesis protein